MNYYQRKKLLQDSCNYILDERCIFRIGNDGILRRCISGSEINQVLYYCHSSEFRGHFKPSKTATKIWQSGYYWLTTIVDSYTYCRSCDRCQRMGNLSWRDKLLSMSILAVEPFDIWGIDFMGLFPKSTRKEHILIAIDYVTKWLKLKTWRITVLEVF